MIRVLIDDATREPLQALWRKPLPPRVRDRIEMVILSDAGWSAPQIVAHLDCGQTVRDLLRAFLARGLEALQPFRTGPGPDIDHRNRVADELKRLLAEDWTRTSRELAEALAERGEPRAGREPARRDTSRPLAGSTMGEVTPRILRHSSPKGPSTMRHRLLAVSRRRSWLPALVALLGLVSAAHAADAPRSRPNVLFIAADDLNTRVGPYGASYVKTPNLDRLAARGVRFDRAYCQYPVCNASRTSVLSGLYPDTTRTFGNQEDPRAKLPDAVLLPELFRKNGYYTAGMGKIAHGPFAAAVSWDWFQDPRGGADDEEGAPGAAAKAQRPRNAARKAAAKKAGALKKAAARKAAAAGEALPFGWQATTHGDDQEPDGQTARRIARLLEEHRAGPFFLAAGFHKPHVNHVAPKPYFDLYPPAAMPLAPRGGDPVPRLAATKFYPELTDDQQRQIIAHYAAVTTFMDAQLGVLLDAMDRLKLWDNTVVVFWSDHGWHHGEHGGIWAKFTLLDESARVPLIVAGPGIRPGVAPGLVELVDLYPTLAELCGLSPPAGLQGRSFAPQLHDPTAPGKDTAYTVVKRGPGLARAIRTPRFTYIAYPDGTDQLFAASDTRERDNLADDPAHAATLAEMKRRLEQTVARASRGQDTGG